MNENFGPDEQQYGRLVVIGTLYVGAFLAHEEPDEERAHKMRRVLGDQADAYNVEAGDDGALGEGAPGLDVLEQIPTDWSDEVATTYLVDLLFTVPFSPNRLEYSTSDWTEAMRQVTRHLELRETLVEELIDCKADAAKAHRDRDWRRIALFGGGGMVLVALTAGAAAPFIAAAAGGASGLAGAAALLHGMALLGGESLAAGGLGMAGGFWIVTGTGALLGAVGGSSASLLIQLGATGATAEIVKLQVSFTHVTLPYKGKAQAAEIVGKLATERDEIRSRREAALERNEEDAPAVRELEAIIEAMTDAMRWMNEQLERS